MITVRTTCGTFTMVWPTQRLILAVDVLREAEEEFPYATFTHVVSEFGNRFGTTEVVPDNSTVFALADQPTDA